MKTAETALREEIEELQSLTTTLFDERDEARKRAAKWEGKYAEKVREVADMNFRFAAYANQLSGEINELRERVQELEDVLRRGLETWDLTSFDLDDLRAVLANEKR